MNAPLLYFVATIYAWVGVSLVRDGRWAYGMAWMAYAVANVGFALDLRSAK